MMSRLPRSPGLAGAFLLCAWLGFSCAGGDGARHPLYVKGQRLERAGDYAAAAAAFKRCLRMAPGNRPAHVHLAMLYEDHLDDPLAAMYHYSRGFTDASRDAYTEFARGALARLSREWVAAAIGDAFPPPAEPAADTAVQEDVSAVHDELLRQKEFLLAQLREKTSRLHAAEAQVRELRERLALTSPPEPSVGDEPRDDEPRGETVYTVKKGDTLIGIAREWYGSPRHWPQLRNYNDDVLQGGDRLTPGMRIRIPDWATLERER